jgi:hypothetical protein
MHAVIHAADVQDRDGGVVVMASLFGLYPFLLKLYADGGYQGAQFKAALQRVMRQVNLEIVKRSDAAKTTVAKQTDLAPVRHRPLYAQSRNRLSDDVRPMADGTFPGGHKRAGGCPSSDGFPSGIPRASGSGTFKGHANDRAGLGPCAGRTLAGRGKQRSGLAACRGGMGVHSGLH